MTKKLLLCCFLTAASALSQAPPAVSTITFDNISHSDLRVLFTSTGTWDDVRLRYAASPATCTSGSGANLETSYGPEGIGGIMFANAGSGVVLSGLTPNTTYQVCVELSNGGVSWTSGVGASVTTLRLPAIHPVPPAPPATFDTGYPNTTGYMVYTTASDCHDLNADWNAAIANQMKNGSIINIPAGSVCIGTYQAVGNAEFAPTQLAPDVVNFTPGAVSTSANTITIPSHGYSEGQQLIFGTSYSCLPGSDLSAYCNNTGRGPINPGSIYYEHTVDSNTIQVYSGGTMANGGTLLTFSNQGNGNNLFVVKWPRPLNWIVIRTSTPDSQFAPVGTRVTPAWAPKMATLVDPIQAVGQTNNTLLTAAGSDTGNVNLMVANVRFVGLELTYATTPNVGTTNDPKPWYSVFLTTPTNQNIIFDRGWIHGLGTPNRVYRVLGWDGKNVAFLDSYFDNMVYFHSTYAGLTVTKASNTQFTIAPGTHHMGAVTETLASTATVNITGGTGTGSAFAYFDFAGNFKISQPPGLTMTCSGCTIVPTSSEANGVYDYPDASGGVFPTSIALGNLYIDPIFSTDSGCGTTTTLNTTDPASLNVAWAPNSGGAEFGNRFYSDTAGYVCGVRFYKNAADTGTHTVSLWSDSGTILATNPSASETASGWQTVLFSSAVAIAANTNYVASQFSSAGARWYSLGMGQNGTFDNAPLHLVRSYSGNDSTCNTSSDWPRNAAGDPAAGEVACINIASGSITSVVQADAMTSVYATEGCQCLIGGIGPGPWMAIGNYISGAGLIWHHDDSGWEWAIHGDYTYQRNTFNTPLSTMYGGAQSDGFRYFHRQPLEWKSGNRIQIYGNIFDGSYIDVNPSGATVTLTNYLNAGITDVDVEYNTFRHVPGIMQPSGVSPTHSVPLQPSPGNRFLFRNNLAWDINATTYCVNAGECNGSGDGFVFQGPTSQEDVVIDHNTIAGSYGSLPGLMTTEGTRVEGVQVTNNFMLIDGATYGILEQAGNLMLPQCTSNGEAAANCVFTPSYVWDHNVMIGNGITQAALQAAWPIHASTNYIPANTSLSSVGWFNYQTPVALNGNTQNLDFHLKSNYCSGCGSPSSDGRDIGANIDALEAAQGKTILIGVPASSITTTSATVVFVAPDAQGCPVDYSSTDPTAIGSFTRVSDAGGVSERNVALTGLTTGTIYYYRVNCAVEQPTGQFRTN